MNVPGFIGPAYTGRSSYWDGQDLVNLFPVKDDAGGKSPVALVGTPGMVAWATLSATGGQVRGLLVGGDGNLYAVCGPGFYQVTSAGAVTNLGTLVTSTGQVSMAQNMGVQIILADGANGYLYTFSGGTFAQIVNANFPGANQVEYFDSYFVVTKPNSNFFYLSALNNGSTWDGITNSSKMGRPDNIVAMLMCHRELWLFGQVSTEVWYDTGAAAPTFPLSPISGIFIEHGCGARASVAVLDNTAFWLTDKLQVVRANGFQPQIVSTRPLEYLIGQYAVTSDAQAFAYVQGGHTFYVLTFPTQGVTWVYDCSTQMWHRRKSFGQGRWRANCHAYFNGMHIVGDEANGKLYQLSETAYTEDGKTIERIRTSAPLSNENKRISMKSLTVDFQMGVGLPGGQGQTPGPGMVLGGNPQAILQWSDDGGNNWSNENWVSLGAIGQYTARARWRRLGSFRSRQFRVRITDPVPVVIVGAYAEMNPGIS